MSKIRLLYFFFCLFFLVIVIKLFYLQVISPSTSSSSGYLKYRRIMPERGKIYDRNLNPLVLNKPSYSLFIEPKKVKNKQKTIDTLSNKLELDESTIAARLDMSKDWVSIARGISKKKKDALTLVNLPGVDFNEGLQRSYPEASLAAHIVGFVGKNKKGEDTGYFGIEGYYDKDLLGLPGFIKTERDLLGRLILLGNQEKIESEDGRDLVLTLDKAVQQIVKERLKRGLDTYKAKEGCVGVADPFSMEILSLVCLPDYDPEKYYEFSEQFFANSFTASLYEPGSTFKPFIMVAGLDTKKIKPDDFFNEKGAVKIGEYNVRTWNNKYEGKISMTRILEKSSNVGMVYVGDRLGKKNMLSYLKKYNFGKQTGIDLEGETAGYLKPESQWYPIDYATVTFGQGIAVSPIQMLSAFSSLINGGELLRPHVVKKIIYGNKEKVVDRVVVRRTISEKTSETIKKMLISTVEHGEYKWSIPKGYKIGGKTGTAQIAVKGVYDPSKTIASFIGFAPADKPRFIALVILKEPKTSIYGSETAAPLFFEIAKELLIYYNISPQ